MPFFHIDEISRPGRWRPLIVTFLAVGLSLLISAALLAFQGTPPLTGMTVLLKGAFGSRWALEDALAKAVPIFLCSIGVAVAFRLRIWNIGAEGQFAMGAIGAAGVALYFPGLPRIWMFIAMFSAAAITGGIWGWIPAVLRVTMRANEIIVTLMFNYLAILILDYLVYGPWKDPQSYGFPVTTLFPDNAVIGKIGSSGINWGIFVCLIVGVSSWFFFRYTRIGYEIRAAGENAAAARYAHIPYGRLVFLVMALSGALAGWAGLIEASASVNRLQPSIMTGYGYTAIVVAWLAQLNPLIIAVVSFLLAGLKVGMESLQLDFQVPAAFGRMLEGLILLTVLAGGFFNRYRIRFRNALEKMHES